MDIDNSRAADMRVCPFMYFEKYERNGTGIEPNPSKQDAYLPRELGTRVHQLLQNYYREMAGLPLKEFPSCCDALEQEAAWIMSAYRAHYPNDQWRVLFTERTFRVPLLGGHSLIGMIDLGIEDLVSGKFQLIDHKTEQRGAKSNLPQKWAARDQATLYLYAASQLEDLQEYSSEWEFVVNVLTRPSPKGLIGPTFPERMPLVRTPTQIEIAVRDITLKANEIEKYREMFGVDGVTPWPAHRENCYTFYPCDFYRMHLYGEDATEIIAHQYHPREEYLQIEPAS